MLSFLGHRIIVLVLGFPKKLTRFCDHAKFDLQVEGKYRRDGTDT